MTWFFRRNVEEKRVRNIACGPPSLGNSSCTRWTMARRSQSTCWTRPICESYTCMSWRRRLRWCGRTFHWLTRLTSRRPAPQQMLHQPTSRPWRHTTPENITRKGEKRTLWWRRVPRSSNSSSMSSYSFETGAIGEAKGQRKLATQRLQGLSGLHAWGKRVINFEPQHAMKEKTIDKSQERHHSTVR